MTLRASEMKRLLADSSRMHEPNHAKWIAEAVNALRSTRDPRGAITLLKTIRSHNNRERERRSLDDVLSWIERRLRTEPTVDRAPPGADGRGGERSAEADEADGPGQ